jgi:hypothetical protein
MPLLPAPMIKHDGTEKKDGARQAAKRCMTKLRQDHPQRKGIVTADSRSANAPPIETRHDAAWHSILGGTAGEHPYVCNQGQAAEDAGAVTEYARHDRATGVVQRCRFVNAMPLHASSADVRVNFIEEWERTQDQVQPCRWVTDLRVSKRKVSKLMQGGRARWKRAHEPCNTLQNQGDNCEHTDGHGTKHRSVVCALVMMLAFVVDQTQQRCCALCQAVWAKLGSTRRRWERRRALCYDDALASMRHRRDALWYGLKQSDPLVAVAASASLHRFPGRLRAIEPSDTPSLWGNDGYMTRGVGFPQDNLGSAMTQVAPKNGREDRMPFPLSATGVVEEIDKP